ncbi:MAG: aminotransferase class I/II-fold pyridoxal phosphate-dependent enzyme, partial [Saccharospirillum sp.]
IAVVKPPAGMFVMVDIRSTGLTSQEFADHLLNQAGVSVLSGEAFGPSAAGFVRLSLTVDAERLTQACQRIGRFATSITSSGEA